MAFEQGCPFNVTPYDKSNIVKTPQLKNVNYTNQDFYSMKSRLISLIKEEFGDTFNDFVESDIVAMLIENWAFVADTLSFKMDQIANEIFIDTVSEVDNAFRLSQLVGFQPVPPIGARALFSAQLNQVLETNLTIDAPIVVDYSTDEGTKTFELFPADTNMEPVFNESIIIPSGNFINTNIIGIEGKGYNQIASGTGESNQAIPLNFGPVIYKSIRVRIDGAEWAEVDYFTSSQPRKEFRVEYDSNYNAFIIFGNQRAGMIPSESSQMSINFRVGGGISGNIVTGSVGLVRNFIVPGLDFRITVEFRNYTKGEFGYVGDTIEDIKNNLPLFLRTQDRAVSGDDYEIIANQFVTPYNGQIGKSTAALRNYGCAANVIDLFVLTQVEENGLEESSNELKNMLQEEINKKKIFTDYVCIRDGVVVETDIAVDVVLDKFYKKFEDELREKTNRRIDTFFALHNWDYEKTLKDIDLVKALADINEFSAVEVNFTTVDPENSGSTVTTKFYEIIRPKTITLNFIFE